MKTEIKREEVRYNKLTQIPPQKKRSSGRVFRGGSTIGGTRHLVAAAVAVAVGVAGPALSQDRLQMHSLWQDGDSRAVHTGLLSRSDFEEFAEGFIADGLRLIDVETAVVNGARGFSGLWVEGSGGNFFFVGGGLDSLRNQMTEMRREGLRLVDFEVFRSGGDVRYLGVFGPGSGREAIVRPLPIATFLERKDLMRTLGFRMRDVEVVVIGGRWRFAALYSTEAPPAVFTGFRPRARFVELRDRMVSDGWELFDFERVPNADGDDVYIGLWREGDGPSRVSLFRSPAEQLFFTAQQLENGAVPTDVELKVVTETAPPPPPPPPPPPDVPDLPDNLLGIVIAGANSQQLIIEFDTADDQPPRIEIPSRWLPSWLPQKDDHILVSDAFCGFNIRYAGRISWQIPDETDYEDDVFRSREVTGSNNINGGIAFSGPIGACAETEPDWIFGPPFTAQEQAIVPLPGMRLVIEGANAELRFQGYDAPVEETFSAFDLFQQPTTNKLLEIREAFAELAAEGEQLAAYCTYVGGFWTAVCLASGGPSCPPVQVNLPQCSIE